MQSITYATVSLLLDHFYTPASIFYLSSARERLTGHFLISNISTGNIPLCHRQHVAREI